MSRIRHWPSTSLNRVRRVSLSGTVPTTVAVAALFSGGKLDEGGMVFEGIIGVNSSQSDRVGRGGPTGEGSARTGSLLGHGELAGGGLGEPVMNPIVVKSTGSDGEERVVKAGEGTGVTSEAPYSARGGVAAASFTSLTDISTSSHSSSDSWMSTTSGTTYSG